MIATIGNSVHAYCIYAFYFNLMYNNQTTLKSHQNEKQINKNGKYSIFI